ncbi:VanZ family protein [Persephonella sp.]
MDKLFKFIFVLYAGIILFLSFYPVPETATSDKLNHFIAFFIFVILLKYAFKIGYWSSFFYSLFYGAFIEIVQYFLPYRSAEYGDFSADLLGILCGLFTYFLFQFVYLELKEEA